MSKKSPSEADQIIGSRIRLRRTALGMSQEKLGEILGVTFQQVQKYEKGSNRVGAGRLQAIADALDVPASFFFEGQPSSTRPSANSSSVHALLTDQEVIELAQIFTKIENPAMRRALIDLARVAANSQD